MRRNRTEPVEGSGLVFSVAGAGSILDTFVGTFLSQRYPAAAIQRTSNVTIPTGSVRIEVAPHERWMFLSTAPGGDRQYVQALSDGASAVLGLDAPSEEIDRAFEALVTGHGPYVPNALISWLASSSLQRHVRPAEDLPRLTPREHEVLRLVVEGYTNAELADALSISTNTVRTHLHAVSVKLDVPNRARLIARARSLGLVGDSPAPGTNGLSELSA